MVTGRIEPCISFSNILMSSVSLLKRETGINNHISVGNNTVLNYRFESTAFKNENPLIKLLSC